MHTIVKNNYLPIQTSVSDQAPGCEKPGFSGRQADGRVVKESHKHTPNLRKAFPEEPKLLELQSVDQRHHKLYGLETEHHHRTDQKQH